MHKLTITNFSALKSTVLYHLFLVLILVPVRFVSTDCETIASSLLTFIVTFLGYSCLSVGLARLEAEAEAETEAEAEAEAEEEAETEAEEEAETETETEAEAETETEAETEAEAEAETEAEAEAETETEAEAVAEAEVIAKK